MAVHSLFPTHSYAIGTALFIGVEVEGRSTISGGIFKEPTVYDLEPIHV